MPSSGRSPRCLARILRASHTGTGSAFPFTSSVGQLAVLDDVPRGLVDPRAHDHATRLRGGLQPGRCVHRVAGQHPVTRAARPLDVDEHLARLHTDPHRELRFPFVGEPAVQLREHGLHLEGGADGPIRVVFVRARHTEDRQDRVTHELLEEPLVPRDLLRQPIERPTDDRLDDLRVLLFGEGRRSDEVGEQGGGELPLEPRGLRRSERLTAVQAEAGALGILLPAAGTRAHDRKGRTPGRGAFMTRAAALARKHPDPEEPVAADHREVGLCVARSLRPNEPQFSCPPMHRTTRRRSLR